MQLDHAVFDSVTEHYAALEPDYLATVTPAIDGIMKAIEALCPHTLNI
jgi:hypothetical protein